MHASMGCPFAHRDPIQYALQKCPFLHAVAQQQGEAFAQNIASRPGRPALGAPAPVFEESFGDVQATFELFHGSSGVVPLVKRPQLQQQGVTAKVQTLKATFAGKALWTRAVSPWLSVGSACLLTTLTFWQAHHLRPLSLADTHKPPRAKEPRQPDPHPRVAAPHTLARPRRWQ